MPNIVQIHLLEQRTATAPAQYQRRADGSDPTFIVWRAAFLDDTGTSHFAGVPYGLCETQKVDYLMTGTGTFDDDGNEIFSATPILLPYDCPEASALLAAGDADGAVAADIARVKADLEDPAKPQGVPL